MKRYLSVILLCGGAVAAHAQGTVFSYAGRLVDNGGPASGIYDLQFTIFDVATGGILAGPVTNSPTDVNNGLFTVMLDFGAGVFTGADRWLEIGVRTNCGDAFTTFTPRQPVTPWFDEINANATIDGSPPLPSDFFTFFVRTGYFPAVTRDERAREWRPVIE
jgi:hypothetical protein